MVILLSKNYLQDFYLWLVLLRKFRSSDKISVFSDGKSIVEVAVSSSINTWNYNLLDSSTVLEHHSFKTFNKLNSCIPDRNLFPFQKVSKWLQVFQSIRLKLCLGMCLLMSDYFGEQWYFTFLYSVNLIKYSLNCNIVIQCSLIFNELFNAHSSFK